MPSPILPELSVTNWHTSVQFYTALGFRVAYARPEEGFARLQLGAADLMLDQIGVGRDFDSTLTAADRPFGRGINLSIEVSDIAPLVATLARAGTPLYLPVEDRWYRRDSTLLGNRQFVVADPDGYLLRFFQDLGTRPA